MKKRLTWAVLVALVFYTYGIMTVYLEIFPYQQLQHVKKHLLGKTLPLAGRDTDTTGLVSVPQDHIAKPRVLVTYGQSNSVNASQPGYQTSNEVYMFLNGSTYRFEDPSLGGTGMNGSVWGRVGDQLIDTGYARSIVFVSTGWGGASINELTFGYPYVFFERQLKSVIEQYGKVDGILFHQGESNHVDKQGSTHYKRDFLTLYSNLRTLTEAPVYLSLTSICRNRSDEALLNIQDQLIQGNQGVLRGPNTDLLADTKYRLPDYCHFSSAGLDAFADLWVEAIVQKSEL